MSPYTATNQNRSRLSLKLANFAYNLYVTYQKLAQYRESVKRAEGAIGAEGAEENNNPLPITHYQPPTTNYQFPTPCSSRTTWI
ncbi:MAG: hypothetical protein CLLPBCKN_008130 [Chroococcidiopsis cubana SAG 39.79]|jgi:hypothetical protein|uniref:Uncharacterized protein n=1 Tax=Chroococcidiopsis cubana SAG 39.79 TaxID=388085 RepID=A0AB37UMG7_9CYAN|nr:MULTISPECIES: hypothetical protein [Chroococcidiopsis]MDZ4878693.1 hypothetical protein [Chroococcidiopsis cubana SAG 39.79]RUT12604.1 hypothetical protein DSM107010_21960 [Chroococcidiopsis cubana SAG 39.79]URD48914.1 hypothetical protein M5J74_21600 [Chroococcidiopsis sp. CCNUC1]